MITLKSTSRYFLALLVSGFCLTQAQEQTVETSSLKPGAWALEFGISSNFTLVSFQGASISAQHHTSATNALASWNHDQWKYTERFKLAIASSRRYYYKWKFIR